MQEYLLILIIIREYKNVNKITNGGMKLDEIENDLKNKTYKILAVDDEEDVLDSLVLTLENDRNINCRISTAMNGEEALAKMFNQFMKDYEIIDS